MCLTGMEKGGRGNEKRWQGTDNLQVESAAVRKMAIVVREGLGANSVPPINDYR